ncbi:MAG: coenzyme F420-0:L-glutamate ligase [Clostridia bacterium]|nr:coenzyme F420-0:L-glutamate ligase [Clostridia bacterium]
MMRMTGTTVRGIRMPLIRQGDDLAQIVVEEVVRAAKEEGFEFHDKDVIGVTEAVVARAQGNYATLQQIAADVRRKFPSGEVGVLFPIMSRNRFSMLLKGIAMGADRVVVMLSYPGDEVGNHLLTLDAVEDSGVNPYTDVLTEDQFRAKFGECRHTFTNVDYIEFYKSLGDNIEVVFGNSPKMILNFVQDVIAADIHTRHRSVRKLREAGARTVLTLCDILNESVDGSGFNPEYGLLGSNKATEESVKLFPKDCTEFVERVSAGMKEATGKNVEVMIYGDGAFKDPVGGIWELADPVVSPAYTAGLEGLPNELKLKYIADNQLQGLSAEEADRILVEKIREHRASGTNIGMQSQGTTPRRLTDLLGSLCDLTSGSGDKGTPVILIQGYFDNYASR